MSGGKKVVVLLLVAILNMTRPTKPHKVLNDILLFAAAHALAVDMVNIRCGSATHFALIAVSVDSVKVNLLVFHPVARLCEC